MARPQPPAGFVTIGPGIYISIAPVNGTVSEPNDSAPNVILIFGWMGAQTRHLQHYALKYTELYPHATQIIVKCEPSFFWTSERGKQKRLLPVVEALEALGYLLSTNSSTRTSIYVYPRVLVHSFSNGGGYQLISLSRLLSSKYPSSPPSEHFASALILDSSPSISTPRTAGLALDIAIRNPVARFIALFIILTIYVSQFTLQMILGGETRGEQYLKALLQPRLLPWMDTETPRLYVFSRKDELVAWQDVQQHADAAERCGLDVCREVYEDSAHVAHMRHDPKRYWSSILDLWQLACRKGKTKVIEVAQDDGPNIRDR